MNNYLIQLRVIIIIILIVIIVIVVFVIIINQIYTTIHTFVTRMHKIDQKWYYILIAYIWFNNIS